MRIPPTLLATIAILLSACGMGEAEVNGSPIVAPTTTTTTTVAISGRDDAPDELAQADPAEPTETTSTSVAGDAETSSTTTTTTTTTTEAPETTVAPTPVAAFCTELGRLADTNPHQTGIETNANAYANYIRWEIDELEQVTAPAAIAADFATYIEAERRTLAWVAANGASLRDVRALGDEVGSTLGIADLSAGMSRYFSFLRSECPQF